MCKIILSTHLKEAKNEVYKKTNKHTERYINKKKELIND